MQKIVKKQPLYKRYVSVITRIERDGAMVPLTILWENDLAFPIDKIRKISQKASVVGGCGVCYECDIQGQRRNLYLERGRWFLESQKP